jgi:hypothetical protein
MWPPTVGSRVRPVHTAPESVSPDGDPVPAPGAGPQWARLRYPALSDGNDKREAMVSDVCDDWVECEEKEERERRERDGIGGGDYELVRERGGGGGGGGGGGVGTTVSVVWEDGSEEDGVPLSALGPCTLEPSAPISHRAAAAAAVASAPSSCGGSDPKGAAADARERANARFHHGGGCSSCLNSVAP